MVLMESATLFTRPPLVQSSSSSSSSSSSCFVRLWNRNPRVCYTERRILFVKSPKHNVLDSSCSRRLRFIPKPSASISSSSASETQSSDSVTCKVRRIVSEFESLREPIDRVKRLLDYATLLPEFDESERVPSNRVLGCAVQVWLCVRVDEYGLMRFSADSDSEITKGFCSCLVWILDGASPEEVLMVEIEDLEALNVGVHGRAHSRVNTWHNVLIDMQKRTKVAAAEAEGKPVIHPFMPTRRRDFKKFQETRIARRETRLLDRTIRRED